MAVPVIPPPNFSLQISDSALKQKANLWTDVLNERTQLYGIRKHKYHYDHQAAGDMMNSNWGSSIGPGGATKRSRQQQKPETTDYYCDACDRGFKTREQHSIHTSEHEKCKVKGCNYVAAAKLVKLHYNLQHATGLADKIKESSQDIQKWIEERRRNFPTAANVQRKQEELMARQERGEVIETKQFGRMGRGRRGRGGRGRGGHFRHSHQQMSTANHRVDREADSSDPLSCIASSQMNQSTHISHTSPAGRTDRVPPPAATAPQHSTPAAPSLGGLGSLLSSYGNVSSSEEEGEIQEPPQPAQSPAVAAPSTNQSAEGSVPPVSQSAEGRVPATSDNGAARPRRKRKNKGKSTMHGQQQQQNRIINKSKSSLLEKLLANEIRHERNVLLQCVRFVVKEEFFGVGQKEKTTTDSCYVDDDVW